jgi:hypothetical protein
MDNGMSYADLVALAVGTGAFEYLAGGRSNTAFVNFVYKNVVGVAPSDWELNYYVAFLESGAHTQASLALLACQVDVNTQSADIIGLAATGIEFTPFG